MMQVPSRFKKKIILQQKIRFAGLLSTGHLPTIGTLLLPVKTIGPFETLFFLR